MNNNITICLVDDNPEITELLECHLQHSPINCKAVSFNDPALAIDYVKEGNPAEVVITDFHMGEINGYDVLNSVPDESFKIVVSGHITDAERTLIKKTDAVFFDKPIIMRELDQAILQHINREVALTD